MANIPLPSNTFKVIPEGEHIFRIYRVDYNETFGKLNIYMVTADGFTHVERFSFIKKDKTTNSGAYTAFAYFAKTALSDSRITSVDPHTLLNRYIKGKIEHTVLPKRDNPDEDVTFTKITEKWSADGYDKEPCEKALKLGTMPSAKQEEVKPVEVQEETPTEGLNLDDLLN